MLAKHLAMNDEPDPVVLRDVPRDPDKIHAGIRETIRSVIEGDKPWPLVFVGPAGTGKTCAALCLLDRCFGMYRTMGEWCAQLRKAEIEGLVMPGGNRTLNHFELWDRWNSTRLGVVDEIGSRDKVSDHHYEVAKRSIDDRLGQPAIFISNLSLETIGETYDDRIASRLSAGTVINFVGTDRRLT